MGYYIITLHTHGGFTQVYKLLLDVRRVGKRVVFIPEKMGNFTVSPKLPTNKIVTNSIFIKVIVKHLYTAES